MVGHFVGENAPHIGKVHATVNRIWSTPNKTFKIDAQKLSSFALMILYEEQSLTSAFLAYWKHSNDRSANGALKLQTSSQILRPFRYGWTSKTSPTICLLRLDSNFWVHYWILPKTSPEHAEMYSFRCCSGFGCC